MELLFHRDQTKPENPVGSDTENPQKVLGASACALCARHHKIPTGFFFSCLLPKCRELEDPKKIFVVAEEERLRAQQNKILLQSFPLSISVRSVKATASIINNNICQKRFSSVKSLPARGSSNPHGLKPHQTPREFFHLDFFFFFLSLKNPSAFCDQRFSK